MNILTSPEKIVVVAGANGALGKLVCEALVEKATRDGSNVLVRGLVRKSIRNSAASAASTGDGSSTGKLKIEFVDYENMSDLSRACDGAHCVVSALQGLEDVIIDAQSRLLKASIDNGVHRFVPSDFSGDFTKLPEGSHRNFDLRRRFHRVAEAMFTRENSTIEFTSIFQGGFTELLGSGWVLFDYKKLQVGYFGSPDDPMEYTTWKNTAEYTACVALDDRPTPRSLAIAGQRMTPTQAQQIAKIVTDTDFALKRLMSVRMLGWLIAILRVVKPGKKGEVMPLWVAMQYGYCGALGLMSPVRLDNDRYPEIVWEGVERTIKNANDQASAVQQNAA